jgi:hypothetical protein
VGAVLDNPSVAILTILDDDKRLYLPRISNRFPQAP